jgi:hypothetical protein
MNESPVFWILVAIVGIAAYWLIQAKGNTDHAGVAGWGQQPAPTGPTVVRVYRGSAQRAAQLFEEDARRLAPEGYRPVNQSYVAGSWGCGAFLIALVLFFILVGILIFIYMLLVKPDGTLTVTYQREAAASSTPAVAPVAPRASDVISDQILQLSRLRDAGVLTTEEFEAKKAELLGRM